MTTEITELRTLGRRSRILRKTHGLTKAALAHKTGLSVATIRSIEGSDETGYNPHVATLSYLAAGLGVKVGELTNKGILLV